MMNASAQRWIWIVLTCWHLVGCQQAGTTDDSATDDPTVSGEPSTVDMPNEPGAPYPEAPSLVWLAEADFEGIVGGIEVGPSGDLYTEINIRESTGSAGSVDLTWGGLSIEGGTYKQHLISRLTPDGEALWHQWSPCLMVETGNSQGRCTTVNTIELAPNGDVYVMSHNNPANEDVIGFWLRKLSGLDGSLLWERYFDHEPLTRMLRVDVSGDPILVGRFTTIEVDDEIIRAGDEPYGFIMRLDGESSELVWFQSIGSSMSEDPLGARVTNVVTSDTGQVVVCGYFLGSADFGNVTLEERPWDRGVPFHSDAFVAALDTENGEFLWAKSFGRHEADYCEGLTVLDKGSTIAMLHTSDRLDSYVESDVVGTSLTEEDYLYVGYMYLLDIVDGRVKSEKSMPLFYQLNYYQDIWINDTLRSDNKGNLAFAGGGRDRGNDFISIAGMSVPSSNADNEDIYMLDSNLEGIWYTRIECANQSVATAWYGGCGGMSAHEFDPEGQHLYLAGRYACPIVFEGLQIGEGDPDVDVLELDCMSEKHPLLMKIDYQSSLDNQID